MRVCVASGKGGVGKTTVAASLVRVWDAPVFAADLDVEAPNLHLFLKPQALRGEPLALEVPVPDLSRCDRCGRCAALCQFKAIALMGETLLVFPEMCHACGGCFAVCPHDALHTGSRETGEVLEGLVPAGPERDAIPFVMGRLRIGEAMSPPLIRATQARLERLLEASPGADAVLDAPPGVSCPAVTAAAGADVLLLVTEPTPFGVHDFMLAWEAFQPMGKPMAMVVNRAGCGGPDSRSEAELEAFRREHDIRVLARIPYDDAIARTYSRGETIAEASPALRRTFIALRDALRRFVAESSPALPKEALPHA